MERHARGSSGNGYLELMDNIPMKEGEKLYFKTEEASVVYISPFGNPITGFLYITDYKVYFRGGEDEQSTKIQVSVCKPGTRNRENIVNGLRCFLDSAGMCDACGEGRRQEIERRVRIRASHYLQRFQECAASS